MSEMRSGEAGASGRAIRVVGARSRIKMFPSTNPRPTKAEQSEMTQPAPPPAQRINPTRPEHLAASSKRQSKFHLLQLYRQLLPVLPAKQSFSTSLHSALGHSLETLPIQAEWDHFSASIWVHRESDMVRLWRQGFFGKGLLSRSEPSWKRRVENRRAEVDGTQKRTLPLFLPSPLRTIRSHALLFVGLTSEEITAARRLERKGVKLVKKAERDAERLQAASAAVSVAGSVPPSPALSSSSGTPLPGLPEELEARLEGIAEEREADAEGRGEKDGHEDEEEDEDKDVPPELWQLDVEHTQLQPEEAFFLLFSLGCLSLIVPPSPFNPPPAAASASPSLSSTHSRPLSILSALRLFLLSAVPTLPPTLDLKLDTDPRLNRLDNPFFLQYAAYHHYRSMGWVVRSGVKFCTDWVLYGPGGPVGGHAECAVNFPFVLLPLYL